MKVVAATSNQPVELSRAPEILVIDSEHDLVMSISESLRREGFHVKVARDGAQGIELFRAGAAALIVLDLVLPGLSGLDVCRLIRVESTVPIVILSARDSEADKVSALELGADDYMVKPFSTRELISRVRAHLRRVDMSPPAAAAGVLRGGPVEIDLDRHEVRVRGREVDLTRKEFELLQEFLLKKGRLRTRSYLIGKVWGTDYFGDTKTLDVHVKRLRNKIERNPHQPEYLVTVRGVGYRFLDDRINESAFATVEGSETA